MTESCSAPMGRREARKAERREIIVEIATRTFLENGYDRTAMSAIAEEMGGSKTTLWSYFTSKEELFAAVIESATAAFRAVMTAVLDPKRDVREALTNFSEKFITRVTMRDAIALQRLIISEVERFPEIGRIFFNAAPGRSRALMTDYLAGQMAAGALRAGDPGEAAEMLLSLCTGGCHQRVLWGVDTLSEEATSREAARIVRLFLCCYGPEQ